MFDLMTMGQELASVGAGWLMFAAGAVPVMGAYLALREMGR